MRQIKVIPFDINLISSENVFTKDGRKVRILCTDRKDIDYPIVGLVDNKLNNEEQELIENFTTTGKYYGSSNNSDLDLVIHKELIINLCFEPFQKILVRRGGCGTWYPAFYSHKSTQDNGDNELIELHYTIGDRRGYNENCILPYDDFKQLVNTSDNPTF